MHQYSLITVKNNLVYYARYRLLGDNTVTSICYNLKVKVFYGESVVGRQMDT